MNNFSDLSQKVLQNACALAGSKYLHNYVGTEHVGIALIESCGADEETLTFFSAIGLDSQKWKSDMEETLSKGSNIITRSTPYTPRTKKALALAGKEAKRMNQSRVEVINIFLGLLIEGQGVAARALLKQDIDLESARKAAAEIFDPRADVQRVRQVKSAAVGLRFNFDNSPAFGHLDERSQIVIRQLIQGLRFADLLAFLKSLDESDLPDGCNDAEEVLDVLVHSIIKLSGE